MFYISLPMSMFTGQLRGEVHQGITCQGFIKGSLIFCHSLLALLVMTIALSAQDPVPPGSNVYLNVGQVYVSSITRSDERDGYDLNIPTGGEYRITVEGTPQYTLSYSSLYVEGQRGAPGRYAEGRDRAQVIMTLQPGQFRFFVNYNFWPYLGTYAVSVAPSNIPYIERQPVSLGTVPTGQIATFSVDAIGSAPLQFQWSKNGEPIPGATERILSIQTENSNGIPFLRAGYRVIVSNNVGSVTSNEGVVFMRPVQVLAIGGTINETISFNGETDSYRIEITDQGAYTFDAIASNRDPNKSLSGARIQLTDIRGTVIGVEEDYSPYTIARLSAELNAGVYFINVSSSLYWGSSKIGTYRVTAQGQALPVITSQPTNISLIEGQLANFQVVASSIAPLTYQWLRNGEIILGGTNQSYQVTSTEALHGSRYQVRVSSVAGTVLSEPATLSVTPAPTLAVGQSMEGSIDPVGDVDWYHFTITEAGGYQAKVSGSASGGVHTLISPGLKIVNSNEEVIAYNYYNTQPLIFISLVPGTYRIQVDAKYAGYIGTYAVSLVRFQAPSIITQPINQAIIVGQAATFGVDVAGDGNLLFQWTRNGENISGATGRSYSENSNDISLNGSQYRVIVTNEAGNVTSNPATLTVTSGLTQIISGFGPFGPHVFGDAPIELAGVTGGASGNPVILVTNNSSVATVAGSSVTIQHAGTAIITASQAGTAQYMPAAPVTQTLVVSKASQIITFADLGTLPYGMQSITLAASVSSALPVTLRVISGHASLNGRVLSISEAGDVVVAAEQSGDADHTAAISIQRTLIVTASAPQITVQPVGGVVAVGGSITMAATVSNSFNATYQWFAGNAPIPGAIQPQYLATAADATIDYHLEVTNRYGSTTSSIAQVVGIQVPVRIVTQPKDVTVLAGSAASFAVVAEGSQPISYQWKRNGVAIAGATGSALLLPAVSFADDSAVIQVDVTNPLGTVRSNEARVQVFGPPQITVPPFDITRYSNSSATFTVAADSLGTIAYQWYRDNQVVIGATNQSYTLSAITSADDGANFMVVLTNSAGSTPSTSATLHVLPRQIQNITGFGPLTSQTLGTNDFVLWNVVGGGSGNPVIFSSSDQSVATIVGSAIHAVGVGTAHISASQAGNLLYAPATTVTQDLTVVTGAQTITFSPVRPQPFGTPPFALAASASSGLPVTLTVVSGPATIDHSQITLTGIGFVTITASQAGNSNYTNAENVTRTVEVTATAPIIGQQPNGITAPVGSVCSLQVGVTNNRYATYQWFRNGSAIPSATQALFAGTTPGLDVVDVYHVEVSNVAGTSVSNDAMVRGILLFPSITRQPQSTAVYRGGTAEFNIGAQGSAPLSIQWFRNEIPMPGATSTTWSYIAVKDDDNRAQIRVTVSNAAGTTTSQSVTLRVHAAPLISVQPADISVDLGMPATFTATVDSTLPATYQWLRGGFEIAGATESTYTLPSTAVVDDNAVLRLVVTNELGVVTSNPATLRVMIVPPVITQQPTSVVLTDANSQVDFVVVVRSGLPVTYQWYRDGTSIPGGTGSHYTLTPTDIDLGVVFFVIITNDMGSVTSANATITRIAKPVITLQPESQTVELGALVAFQVQARSFDPVRTLTYQWRRNGLNIPGETSTYLTLPSIAMIYDGAVFTVLVSDGPATQVSQGAVLRVLTTASPVYFISQSGSQSVDPSTQASFNVTVRGSSPIAYQWYRNGQAITGATQSRYITAPVTNADYGTVFRVEVSNPFGSITSNDMQISSEPWITAALANPSPFIVPRGESASLRVTVRGQRPIGFRWYRNDVLIPDAMSDTYVLPPVTSADQGALYSVTAWNIGGEAMALWPLAVDESPPIIQTQPQDQSVPLGESVFLSVVATSLSEVPTYQWYRDGVSLVGETQANLFLQRIVASDVAAHFHVVVTNRFGSVTSRDAQLSVRTTLAIVTQPRSVSVNAGENLTLSVVVNTPAQATYSWRRNGVILGLPVTSPSLTLTGTSIADSGAIFDVVVKGPFGQTVTSDAVTLTVIDNPPVITVQPVDVQATVGQNAIFSVTTTGSQPMHYQWSRDGVVTDDQDASTLSVPIWSLADDGAKFQVVVSNQRGRVTSTTATLTARFIPGTVITDPDIVAEIHGDSVIIHPTALVSNGDRTGILYRWDQLSGAPLKLSQTQNVSARLLITDLIPGSYAVRCTADYNGFIHPIATTQHIFKFNVTRPLNWITSPRMVGTLSPVLAARLAAVAGFGSTEDSATRYHWSQISGPSGATFVANDTPAAKENQIQLPENGRYTIVCTADWRGTKISRQVTIDTDAKPEDPNLLATLSNRTLLVAASTFDATRWQANADYRTTYLAGVEPGRVWQSSPSGEGLLAIRSSDSLHRHAIAGATITLHVHVPVGAPVSLATLHGGSFVSNSLNAISVAANDAGDVSVDVIVPNHSGTYLILAASPFAVGRLSFTVVVP